MRDGDIAVVDFDGLCVAAQALKLATYAADVVHGGQGDLEKLQAVLEPLLEGYGDRPNALEWHVAAAVLARAAHSFQRQVPGWRDRVEATVAVAEAEPWLGRSSPAVRASSARRWPRRCSRTATKWSASTASPTTIRASTSRPT